MVFPAEGRGRMRIARQSYINLLTDKQRRGLFADLSVCFPSGGGGWGLFEVEGEDDHGRCGPVDALGVDELGGVGEIGTVFLQDVVEAEAEFELGDELEEGEIEVASESGFEHHVEGLGLELGLLACREVVHGGDAGDDVGAIVVEAWCGDLEVDGQAYVAGLHVEAFFALGVEVAEGDVFGTEMEGGEDAQGEVVGHFPFAEHAYGEAEVGAVGGCDPLVGGCGVGVSVVLEMEPLVVEADEETIVETAFVDERLVLHFPLLGVERGGKEKQANKGYDELAHRRVGCS